ncbi:MAG: inositol monophosphatase family protein [Planctomycetota bacterium]|nr:inositol monophosphatase family protein [Planctomycetota bacterium]
MSDVGDLAWASLETSTDELVTEETVRGAVEAAFDAGRIQRDALGRLGRADARSKSSRRDLVTTVDVASERAIVSRLRAINGAHAIEAEEEVHDEDDGRPRWFVDPLDGTVNYFHGLPLFCVSIGLYRGLEPVLGIVHAPALGETFVSAAGAGAHQLRGAHAGAAPLSVAAETCELADAVLATGFPYRRGELEHSNLENFSRFFHEVRGMRRMGSAALDLAFVAAGRLDGFWELHLSPFDVAAGAALVLEAGGAVTDARGGQDWLRGGSIVAAPGELAALMRSRIEA